MPKFSANIGMLWPHLPLLQRIEAAAHAGFRAIEMHWPYDTDASAVAALCRKLDVQVLGINTVPGDLGKDERGLAALIGREQEFAQALQQSIDYGAACSATAIHVMAGTVPTEQRALARRVLLKNLAAAAPKAAANNLTLLLEPLNPRDAPGYFYSTVAEAVSLIADLDQPNIKLQFDVYHVAIAEGDVIRKLGEYMPVIGNVQIAAVPSRAEPDEGEINYPAIFSALDTLGYTGWVGCEYRPRGDTDAGLRWLGGFHTEGTEGTENTESGSKK